MNDDKRRKPVTADELMTRLESDPEWVAMMEAKERKRLARAELNRQDSAPLRAALRELGVEVESVDELHSRRMSYKDAVPVLLEWLPRIDNPHVKESVVRALTVRWARPVAAPAMIAGMRSLRGSDEDRALRFAYANALSEVADDSVFDDVVELLQDPGYPIGDRGVLAFALSNMKQNRARAIEVLRSALKSDVGPNAVRALGDLRASEARDEIAPFAEHEEAWVRTEAKRALKRIDR